MLKQRILFLSAAMLLTVIACERIPEPTPGPADPAPTEMTLNAASFDVAKEGGAVSLTIKAPSRPAVSGLPGWITLKDGTFKDYQITFELTVAANDSYTPREAALTVTAGVLSCPVTVRQAAREKKIIDKSKIAKVPVNPKATAAAKKLYSFLLENYGEKTLSGVQSAASHTNDFVNAVASATGKHPALAGYDFIFLHFSPTPAGWSWRQDYTDISAQKEHWNANGVISYMWHWNVPESEAVYRGGGTDGYAFYISGANGTTPFDIREAVKEGTWQHECILADIDEMAGTFKQLQEAGIPVLFRPLHEAAGNYTKYNPSGGAWFWWGRYGAQPCKALWNLLRDRLENHHGLNNLLWVWTVDVVPGFESAAKEWYPGDDKVDIVGADIYENNTGVKGIQFDFLQEVTGGKKILSVSECGNIPDPAANLEAGNPWSWFMVWNSSDSDGNISLTPPGWSLNTLDYWKKVMTDASVYNRENMPSLK
jgi:mannan endo-1,4-beta-mannosidase